MLDQVMSHPVISFVAFVGVPGGLWFVWWIIKTTQNASLGENYGTTQTGKIGDHVLEPDGQLPAVPRADSDAARGLSPSGDVANSSMTLDMLFYPSQRDLENLTSIRETGRPLDDGWYD